ncbi:MAG: hypothetical protein ACIAXF_03290 [Phycisphaerales bacterium JB063]
MKEIIMTRWILALMFAAGVVCFTGCEEKTDVEEAVDDATEAVEEAGEEGAEAAEEVAEDVENAVNEATE